MQTNPCSTDVLGCTLKQDSLIRDLGLHRFPAAPLIPLLMLCLLADGDILCQLATAIDRAEREARIEESGSDAAVELPSDDSSPSTEAVAPKAATAPMATAAAPTTPKANSGIPVPRTATASKIPMPGSKLPTVGMHV